MGRLIDVSELYNVVMLNKSDWGIFATPIDQFVESLVSQVSTVEAIPKADYEARLKAYMVAMLEDLKQDFIAEAYGIEMDCSDYVVNVTDIDKAIQEKINELKQEPTTKNDLGVDAISRADALVIVKALNKGWELRVNEVLDKIRAEIETKYGRCTLVEYFVQYDGICTGRKDIGDIADILQIIDKYKAEMEK